jgi:hypothetical protein
MRPDRRHRLWAWVLVALVALPFTSPFSTCDVRAFATSRATLVTQAVAALSTGPILLAFNDADSTPLSIEEENVKDDMVVVETTVLVGPLTERPVATPVQAATSVFRTPLVALRL